MTLLSVFGADKVRLVLRTDGINKGDNSSWFLDTFWVVVENFVSF